MSGGTVPTEFQSLQGKPNTNAWSTDESLPSNRLPFIPVHGSVPLSPTIGHHTSSLIVVVVALLNIISILFILSILSLRESGGVCPLAGPIGY